MRWRDVVSPVAMTRVALVAPNAALRDALVQAAYAGQIEFERTAAPGELPAGPAAQAVRRLSGTTGTGAPPGARLARVADVSAQERAGRLDLLRGEAELAEYQAQAVVRGEVAALVGWAPTTALPDLTRRLAPVGAAVVSLARPPGVDPPTQTSPSPTHRAFGPLVTTYATAPYVDVDPTVLAGLAYLVTFGAMFGDAGQGLLLVAVALLARSGRPRRLAVLRPQWIFVAGAGVSATLFGLAYGEFFGPTDVVPVALIAPMEQPLRLLVAGIALGALLLGAAYALGAVNRVREGGPAAALYAPSGVAGALLFLAVGLGVAAWVWHQAALGALALLVALVGLVLAYLGLYAAAGHGAAGATQAAVELFDTVIRLGANIVSFARLAAFGLTHAILGWIVWQATRGLWQLGPVAAVGAVVVFVAGNVVTFALSALVAAVQALRLEYYELFSRVFAAEGRPFTPWRLPPEDDTAPDPPAR
jgi:V/A-type H+-transporting ATPase subunit I